MPRLLPGDNVAMLLRTDSLSLTGVISSVPFVVIAVVVPSGFVTLFVGRLGVFLFISLLI